MLIGSSGFAPGSAMAALAPSVAVLIYGRALGDVRAALALPATLAGDALVPWPFRATTGRGAVVGTERVAECSATSVIA